MQRWIEEVEIIEEEFRRLIRACDQMDIVWSALVDSASKVYVADGKALPGFKPYALQKASMYRRMASDAREIFLKAGGEWPITDETFSDHIRRRRPNLNFNWDEMEGFQSKHM